MKKRRILSIVLSLCMVLALMPQMVFAEEPGNYDELQGIMKDARYGGTVTLTKDYTINNTVTVYDTTLDLNGHVIKMTGNGSVIKVDISSNFTLQDSSEGKTGVITSDAVSGPGFGGGVYVDANGSFTMNGGIIYDCYAQSGGGVFVRSGGSFTMNNGAISGCNAHVLGGGVCVDAGGSFTMNGGTIYNCSSLDGGGVYNCGTLYANGGTIRDSVYNRGLIENATTDGCTVFYGGINIVDSGTINGKKVTFKKDDSTYAIEIVAEGNTAAVPEAPTKAGYEFAGWYTDEELPVLYDFDSEVKENTTLYARFDPVITITVPFTTTVKLGGNVQPGETVFNMQVLDSNGDKYSSGNVEIEAKPVTTNGAGSYIGEITFTGTEAEISNMFRYNGYVFVKQEDADYTNWKIDDTVWCLFHNTVAELSEDEVEVEPSPIRILPAISEYDGDGMYYYPDFPDDDEKQLDKMTFTNTYTKSVYVPTYPIGPTVPADPPGDMDTDEPGDAENPGDTDDPGDIEEPADIDEPADTDDPAEDTEAVADDSDETSDTSPKTGDSTDLAPWIALMILSGAGIGGTTLYTRRKRTNE